jgi:hypothetical protein
MKAAELFIRHHQAVLIRLADTVTKFSKTPKLKAPYISLYEQVGEHLQYLLEFLRSYFTRYFCEQETAPAYYLESGKKDICGGLKMCKKNLQAKGVNDESLLALIFDSFESLCKGDDATFSYQEIQYLRELITELNSLGILHKEGCIYAAITELLIQMNFNGQAFFNYFLAVIHKGIQGLAGKEAKLERLVWHRKEISMMQLRVGAALNYEAPTIQSMLLEAIDKEIQYYSSLPLPEEGAAGHDGGRGAASDARSVNGEAREEGRQTTATAEVREVEARDLMFVPFKGAEIYLLHKAFIDAGGAPGEIYKTLLERVAPFLSNKTQKGFSADSLCKYSDKVTPEVKEDVKRFLMKMVRNVDSYD